MSKKSDIDISISEIEKVESNDLIYSSLTVQFTGSDSSTILVNTFRRALLSNIPVFAFPPECIDIELNTSVFNNDQVRLELSQLPVPNTDTEISYLPDEYWFDVDYSSKNRHKHPSEKQIELYIDVVNEDKQNKYVTTNDIQYYEEGQIIHSKYNQKYPIVLIKLRPTEVFKCHLHAVLGVGERNAIWLGAGNSYFSIDSKNNAVNLTIESTGQLDEYVLLWKSCQFLKQKYEFLKGKIKENYANEKSKKIDLVLDRETFTTCNLLTDVLQNRDDVLFAGTSRPNQLVKQNIIKIEYNKELLNPLEPIMESIDKVILIIEHVERQITSLGKDFLGKKERPKKIKK